MAYLEGNTALAMDILTLIDLRLDKQKTCISWRTDHIVKPRITFGKIISLAHYFM